LPSAAGAQKPGTDEQKKAMLPTEDDERPQNLAAHGQIRACLVKKGPECGPVKPKND